MGRENPRAYATAALREAVALSVGSARQELLTARFLGHHPGCPANSQALGVGWGEGPGLSASQAQTLLPLLSGPLLGLLPSPTSMECPRKGLSVDPGASLGLVGLLAYLP